MKQRFEPFSYEICLKAVFKYLEHKWSRHDTLCFIEKYSGVPRHEILLAERFNEYKGAKIEAAEGIALYLQDVCEDLFRGYEPEEMEPVIERNIPDGMTGKIRNVALLCVLHQLLMHVEVEMIRPLLEAKILPCQHASIPGHGQSGLRDQVHKYLRTKGLIKVVEKNDVHHAYGTLQYQDLLQILKEEIPAAKEAIILMEYLGRLAPGGHLIIGGYLDAWAFNLVMSYALRHILTLGQTRRGVFRPYIVRCSNYMDDTEFFGTSATGVSRAFVTLSVFLQDKHGLSIRETAQTRKLLSISEERRRKMLPKPSQRSCPGVDMAGFVVHRSYITVRPAIFLRARRAFMRAWIQYEKTGSISFKAAQRVDSYSGYFMPGKHKKKKPSDSLFVIKEYHLVELKALAAKVKAYYGRREGRLRMEAQNVYRKSIIEFDSVCGNAGTAGWPKPCYPLQRRGGGSNRRRRQLRLQESGVYSA